jgi:hypothetical protein
VLKLGLLQLDFGLQNGKRRGKRLRFIA